MSLASQLKALNTKLIASKPVTRPTILYDRKTAADISNDVIYTEAITGFQLLVARDGRFSNFKSDLFSENSKELNRKSLGGKENERINESVASYLRLLSGFIESDREAAVRTLEFLVRSYSVHELNIEDLILCMLPYHETEVFVRVVQLIDLGNSKWKFLNGVKDTGAAPPREIIVQQCKRDTVVLKTIVNYATPVKKKIPSEPVVCFTTAVVFEFLGLSRLSNVDSDVEKMIIRPVIFPYVESVLQTGTTSQKAGALMIVTLLAQKVSLGNDDVKKLMYWVAGVTRAGTKEATNSQLLRRSLMALINIVQLLQVVSIPKKVMDILIEIRDISMILSGLSKEFNIDKFFMSFLDSLLDYSVSDESYHRALLSMIENYPMKEKDCVNRVVSKFLAMRVKIYKGKKIDVVSSEPGSKGNQILVAICNKYRNESIQAISGFLEPKKLGSSYEILGKILDDILGSSDEMPNPKCLLMEHSEAVTRKSAVLALDVTEILRDKVAGSKKFDYIQDAIQHRLYDDDLNVVLAALQLEKLTEILNPSCVVEVLHKVLHRCIDILLSDSAAKEPQSSDTALLCLRQAIKVFKNRKEYAMTLATAVFPLILVRPKTQRLNLEGLELARELTWPLFENLVCSPGLEEKVKEIHLPSINMKNIEELAKTISLSPEEYLPWLVECCKSQELSKTLFFLVLLQSLKMMKLDAVKFIVSLLPILKSEWDNLEALGVFKEQSYKEILDVDCKGILQNLLETNFRDLNRGVLSCVFLKLLEALISTVPRNASLVSTLQDLFVFFTSHSTDAFKKHLEYFSTNSQISSILPMMVNLYTEEGIPHPVQVESLRCFSCKCRQSDGGLALELFEHFPSILVPLSSDNQDVRRAAMGCVEELSTRWTRAGNNGGRLDFIGNLLRLIVQKNKMIISDSDVLASFFTTLLGSSPDSLLVQQSSGERLDKPDKKKILDFILKYALGLSPNAKLKIFSLVKGLGSEILSIPGVTSLLNDLLEKRHEYNVVNGQSCQKLSKIEVNVMCLLLESCTKITSSGEGETVEEFILKALLVNGGDNYAIQGPCLSVMRNLSSSFYGKLKPETQGSIFLMLLVLFRSSNGDIQKAARDVLMKVDVDCSILVRVIDSILERKTSVALSNQKKRHKTTKFQIPNQCYDSAQNMENMPSFLGAFLDVLLMKKNIDNRILLVGPLFELLRLVFTSDEWVIDSSNQDKGSTASSSYPLTVSDSTSYIQQTLLLTLENISASIMNDMPQKAVLPNFDLQLLVTCARTSNEAVTRNHVFSLITTLASVVPEKVLAHILDILTVIGESTATQWDSYSQRVFEDLISTIVPHWLSKTGNRVQVLQIFVNVLPRVAKSRMLSVISHVLRILGEAESLGSLLILLFHSLLSRENLFSLYASEPSLTQLGVFVDKQWEFKFSMHLCEQYSCTILLRSLILALNEIRSNDLNEKTFMVMLVAMKFISDKLQDPEMACTLESGEDLDNIQTMICDLMEQVVTHLQLLDSKKKHVDIAAGIKNELKEYIRSVIKTITHCLLPCTYFKVFTKLADHSNKDLMKKALGLLCETLKNFDTRAKIEKKGSVARLRNSWLHLDDMSLKSLEELCNKINQTLDTDVGTPLQLAAVSAIEVLLQVAAVSAVEFLAVKFPSNDSVFRKCLGSVCKKICSDNSVLSCHCLRATGTLINALGTNAYCELPNIMEHVMRRSSGTPVPTASIFTSVLVTLEAIVNKLGQYLSPHNLSDILRLVVLNPSSLYPCDQKLILKADSVWKLMITDKTPARLLIPAILGMYSDAVKHGETSVSILFEMLENLVGSMSSENIMNSFDLCLEALDLRRQCPTSIENIDFVEQKVIKAAVTVSMKLTGSTLRPRFIKTIEWSGENLEGKTNRVISFYSLVNKYFENLRSLFIPYYKLLFDGIVEGLADSSYTETGSTQKKKKAKHSNSTKDSDCALPVQQWHIRALILSSLHKCFLYDTANSGTKFLDSTNFQVLLKPIVSQLVIDPPTSIGNCKNVPSVNEVDDLLVNCISQMAVTAGSDLLWKPLNHEVLMQTRSENVRCRILGLRIVKQLVEKLKEEYLQFLPETIPFLGELLEDSELSVKSLAQEILKEMENMSGESLREYL